MNVYAGHLINRNELNECASGGAASAISDAFINDGGFVFGVKYTENYYSAVYCCVSTIDEAHKIRDSKYFVKNWGKVKEEIAEKLCEGSAVLFIGLGCDIHILKSYLNRMNVMQQSLYTMELVCDGVTRESVHEQYIKGIETKYNSKICYFTTRSKSDGWGVPRIYAEFENGAVHKEDFYASAYGYAFANYKEKKCYCCKFKGDNHPGDIVVGDYWGCMPGMSVYEEKGVSLIIPQNSKGDYLLKILRDNDTFYIKP